MRVASWNINSVRLRLPLLKRVVEQWQPDIFCLQETKTENGSFPAADIRAMGYEHQYFTGMKSYNGVAILSRLPLSDCQIHHWYGKKDCRHVSARLSNGWLVHNIYVPAGGDVPDPALNEKFAHKLAFLDGQIEWWQGQSPDQPAILLGDLNIAPLEHDVWSHRQLLDVVSHTPIEVEKLLAWQQSAAWVDAVRHFVPPEKKLYSWWSYRAKDWQISDRGRRLDHIWITQPLTPLLKAMHIAKDVRGWEQPSDHVPIMIDLASS
ncbi:MAG: exodeoxyribonuclease III [Alphaproteobacteria bacterium]